MLAIRRATDDDVAQMAQLAADFGLFTADPQSLASHAERIAALVADPRHCVVVADHDGVLVGYAHAQDYGPTLRHSWNTARLHDLFVREDHRQSGLGRRLHRAIVVWCRSRQVKHLEWQAAPSSIAFYQHLGYRADYGSDYANHPSFEHWFDA